MADYEIVPGQDERCDVKRDGERIRRGFDTEEDAQRWIDGQID